MATIDYKQKIKDYMNSSEVDTLYKSMLNNLFPELKESKESEDERIRKWLIALIKSNEYGSISNVGEMPCPKLNVLAWLEKQGEKKTIWHNEDEEPQKDSLILLIMQSGTPIVAKIIEPNHTFNHGERWAYIDDLLEKQGEQKLIDKIQPGKKYKCIASPRYTAFMTGEIYKPEDKFLCSLMNFCSDCFEPIEDGGQKPVDKAEPKFKVDDIIKPKDGGHESWQIMQVDILDKKYRFKEGYVIHFSQEDDYELVEQKSAWSEEDENIINHLLAICAGAKRYRQFAGCLQEDITKYQTWLKSLRPQNNITDEELAQAKKDAYNDALNKIEYHSGEPTFDDGWSAAIWYLKKRNTMPQNGWKPSEEQMGVIEAVINNRSFQRRYLDSLYEQLKKLRE